MKFCAGCEDDQVHAWAGGNLHVLKGFGDGDQRDTAILHRKGAIQAAVQRANFAAIAAFPEFRAALPRAAKATTIQEAMMFLPDRPFRNHTALPGHARDQIRRWLRDHGPNRLIAVMQDNIVAPPVLAQAAA